MVVVWHQLFCFCERDADVPWLAVDLFDLLVHGVQTGACEVCLGVGEPLGIVGLGRFHQGQEPLAAEVIDQHTTLPVRPVLQEVLGKHISQAGVLNYEGLSLGRELQSFGHVGSVGTHVLLWFDAAHPACAADSQRYGL